MSCACVRLLIADAVVRQAAKLVCRQRYHRWREARLQHLATWFAAEHPGQLDNNKITAVPHCLQQGIMPCSACTHSTELSHWLGNASD